MVLSKPKGTGTGNRRRAGLVQEKQASVVVRAISLSHQVMGSKQPLHIC
jgi:hypothetical protein